MTYRLAFLPLILTATPLEAQTLTSTVPPRGNPRGWVTMEEIGDATRYGSGKVTVAFKIGADGRISDCAAIEQVGNPHLDDSVCRLLLRRARFMGGQQGSGTYRVSMTL